MDSGKLSWSLIGTIFRLCSQCQNGSLLDWISILGITTFVILYVMFGYLMLLVPGEIYQALINDDTSAFRRAMTKLFFTTLATVIARSMIGFSRDVAANRWRNCLTLYLHKEYLRSGDVPPCYQVCRDGRVDNPDQRIVDDARTFPFTLAGIIAGGYGSSGTDGIGDLGGGILEAVITLSWYSFQTYKRTGWVSVLFAYGWTAVVAFVGYFLVNRTSSLVVVQEALEATFRSSHVEVKHRCEDMAFNGPGGFEKDYLNSCVTSAVQNMYRVIAWRTSLNSVDNFFMYFLSFVMYSALGVAVFSGAGEENGFYSDPSEKAKWIAQTGGIFISLLTSLTIVINLNSPASNLAAQAWRIGKFLDSVTSVDDNPVTRTDGLNYRSSSTDIRLVPKSSLLIAGPNASGKTTLLRRIRALWPAHGVLERPPIVGSCDPYADSHSSSIMFLTGQPYLPFSRPLLEQVAYPDTASTTKAEDETEIILGRVGLEYLLDRFKLQDEVDWYRILSAGEQQRLALARVLYHQPTFAVLDEATSCLDEESEVTLVKAMQAQGIGVVMVSFRKKVRGLFGEVINLRREGHG
ncbi:hypothetical protein NDN08_001099 [Rhodosorus marinus]|uniref:Probable ATP-dependent transporter ycf16 n=1 Tax=Rhodosorus marinus TaxID=101924 RepID=A0AAV8UPZ0_9RHOD|nr:hypothetical protein NDN08_001099 [Rhodosorus marinus]